MVAPTQPRLLPSALASLVEQVRAGDASHADAIEGFERYLAAGGERTVEVLVALATLTYEDAATVVLERLSSASAEALALIDEAIASGGAADEELESLRVVYERTLREERARERRLRALLGRRDRARPAQLAQLAHRILMSGEDDGLAFELMAEASDGHAASFEEPVCASGE